MESILLFVMVIILLSERKFSSENKMYEIYLVCWYIVFLVL